MPKLITTSGPTSQREYELEDSCILGRGPSCQIYIGDLMVSRQHARVTRTNSGYLLEDLGSGNGTFVNEQHVTKHVLAHNDEVRISDAIFRFIADEESTEQRWVSMVTVMADNTSLISIDSKPQPQFVASDTDSEDEPTQAQHLRNDLARAQRMLETLYSVTATTSSVLEPKQLFDRILDLLFEVFPHAERGFIMRRGEGDQLTPGAIRRRKRGDTGGLVVSQSIINCVIHEGKSVISSGVAHENTLTPYTTRVPKMCAPLSAQDQTLGILHIEGQARGPEFTQEDLDLLSGLARQAGVALLNASLHQQLMKQQRLEQDLHFARQVQQSFLPLQVPEVAGYHFDRRYNPLYEVGGDFYDFVPLPKGRIGVLIGDVSGKGVSAALLMARLTSDMRYFAISEVKPARVLARANQSLLENVQDNMFATVLYLVLDPARNKIVIANAGHLPPFMRRADDNSVVELDQATSLALGVLPETVFEQSSVELAPGDTVLLCTDGVVEAKNYRNEEYGFQRLIKAMASPGSERLVDAVLRDLNRFSGAMPQYDDLTLVTFCRRLGT
jgi:serine phosphatase RsbU (regulator of sigma subunit)